MEDILIYKAMGNRIAREYAIRVRNKLKIKVDPEMEVFLWVKRNYRILVKREDLMIVKSKEDKLNFLAILTAIAEGGKPFDANVIPRAHTAKMSGLVAHELYHIKCMEIEGRFKFSVKWLW